jgi:hypothetical protein
MVSSCRSIWGTTEIDVEQERKKIGTKKEERKKKRKVNESKL